MMASAAAPVIVGRATVYTPMAVALTVPITAHDSVRDVIDRAAWMENADPALLTLFRKKRTTSSDGREFEDREDLDVSHKIAEYQILYDREPLFLGWRNAEFVIVKSFAFKEKGREYKIIVDYVETTLGDVRKAISALLGMPEQRFRLILNKADLKDDNKRLAELGLGGLSQTIFMVEKKDSSAQEA